MALIRVFLLIPLFLMAGWFTGCSEDDPQHKLSGQWEGQNSNNFTGQQWNFTVLIEHRGNEISGVYSDYRGSRTLRNITYTDENIGFLIDLWPNTVTYFGLIESRSSMIGTWSYSADDNNGTWYLVKNKDPEDDEEEEEEEDTDDQATDPYFAKR